MFSSFQQYCQQREKLINQVTNEKYKNLKFSEKELQLNEQYRELLVRDRQSKGHQFYHINTLKYRKEFENSKIFKIVKKMPKGAVLHLHCDCAIEEDWFLQEIGYDEHTYFDFEKNKFKYFKDESKVELGFKNLKKERAASKNPNQLDEIIRKRLHITIEESYDFNKNIWSVFESKIMGMADLIYIKDNYKKYLMKMFKTFIDDGVLHIEGKSFLHNLKDEDGQFLSLDEEIQVYLDSLNNAKEYCPDFSFNLIVQGLKMWDQTTLDNYLILAFEAKQKYPQLIVGFDMVQEEDAFKNMQELAKCLYKQSELEKSYNVTLPYVFHGGESLNTITNTNLFDLLLMKSKRIGHGLNLVQHSYLLDSVKKEDICIEVCPVSNQLLRYVTDIRLHPLKNFLNYGLKVAICPDDPGYFGVTAISYDFYFATIGCELDLKDLKLCVHHSIFGSLLSEKQKNDLWAIIEKQWEKFIDTIADILQQQ